MRCDARIYRLPLQRSFMKVRVVVNAGGLNPVGCRDAILAALEKKGVALKVAAVRTASLGGSDWSRHVLKRIF